ncbi:MAG: DUF4783 domain-containing protein [Chitinophagaceae bacterium]|nr:DUF4783 domain-containing protein [Chitinophagaceae bacterium]
MKNLYLLVFTALFTMCSFTLSIEDVIAGIKNGNAAQVSKFFDNTVELTLTDKSNAYSKSQAELVLKDFFTTNTVKNFVVLHKGDNAGSQFCIGTLETKNGAYRTTIYMKQVGDKQVVQELRFEK